MPASWEEPALNAYLLGEYQRLAQGTAADRTGSLADVFVNALADARWNHVRPDAVWTALGMNYVMSHSLPLFTKFQRGSIAAPAVINQVRSWTNSWVKSSGTALQNVLPRLYNRILLRQNPAIALIVNRRDDLQVNPLSGAVRNVGAAYHDLGRNSDDDLYLLTEDGHGNVWIYGAIQVKSSVGDRFYQGLPRSKDLIHAGIFTCTFTLDPMEISRSVSGNLRDNSPYVQRTNGPSPGGPVPIGFHRVFVGRNVNGRRACSTNVNFPCRVFDTRMRNLPDSFVAEVVRARNSWLGNNRFLGAAWD